MLYNICNHPSSKWETSQLLAAAEFGEIVDIPFPRIDPDGDEAYVARVVEHVYGEIKELIKAEQNEKPYVHVMGEMTFSFGLISKLQADDIICLASTTARITNESGNSKTSVFKFQRFRMYPNLIQSGPGD